MHVMQLYLLHFQRIEMMTVNEGLFACITIYKYSAINISFSDEASIIMT